MRSLFIACTLLALLAACDRDSTLRPASPQPEQAAALALNLLQDLVDEHNYKQLGFDSPAQLKQAMLGQPLDIYIVGLDKLRQWGGEEGSDALVLQSKSEETVYPVLVGEQVKSTVSIFRQTAGYRPATFGNAEIARTLTRYRQGEADFIVRVPALGMYFIGRKAGDQVVLTPVRVDSRLPDFPPGRPVPSVQLLKQLGLLAKRPDAELPR
jgi:hypothetical protein